MKLLKNTGLILSVIFILTSCGMNKKQIEELNPVEKVDLERYMGTWYEIARIPNRFEKDLVGVTATYSLRKNGKVDVLNQGHKESLDGKLKKAKGFAKRVDPAYPAWFKVYFFWPFGGDYIILELDQENYQYALIGGGNEDYLWILSRTPKMDKQTYEKLVARAAERKYDVSRIEMVMQEE